MSTEQRPEYYQVPQGKRFVHALARINRAITEASSIEKMLAAVLDEMLDIFDCERAALLYPCDAEAPTWSVPMARWRPGWAALGPADGPQPMTDYGAYAMRLVRAQDGPVRFDPEENPLDSEKEVVSAHSIRSQLAMALYPKNDQPWQVVVHHCVEPRIYKQDVLLFQAIAHRLADGITTLVVKKQLQQSEALYRTLVDNAPEGILIVDSDTDVVLEANPRAKTLLGGGTLAVTGAKFANFSPKLQPDGRPSQATMAAKMASAASGNSRAFEWTHLNRDGGEFPSKVHLVSLPGPPNNLVRVSITDITERKRAEQEREQLHEQLVHAQRLEVMQKLAGGLAHDFNNILTVINMSLELLMTTPGLPPGAATVAQDAASAAKRAGTLTRELLAYTRRQVLQPKAVHVIALLTKMEQLLRSSVGERITLTMTHSAEVWHCRADPTQLENALFNLAINARDAMSQGGELTFEVSNVVIDQPVANDLSELDRGDYVKITVSDTGTGIPPSLHKQIFEPFFTTKAEGMGTGLGLSMVFGFVKQSGGHVLLHSNVDAGSSFELYLPRARETRELDTADEASLAELMGSGEKILIVEDEPAIRKVAIRILADLGYQTFGAGNVQAALAILAENPELDLLFTDVVLPGQVDGVQLARQVRKERPDLPVLLTSGYTPNMALQAGDFTPAVDLLKKPYSAQELAALIRRALQYRRR